MPIKNYTTKVPAAKTVGEVMEILAAHGADSINVEYGHDGPLGVAFRVAGSVYRLPARAEAVGRVMAEQGVRTDGMRAAAVAWRNVKDWVDAQMAMVETGQAEVAEVMMPYMLDNQGHTLYEAMAGRMLEGATRCGSSTR